VAFLFSFYKRENKHPSQLEEEKMIAGPQRLFIPWEPCPDLLWLSSFPFEKEEKKD
jgi:hypothetical protein